jgi:hypothetical protein
MFKKIFFGLSAIALLAACTEDYKDWSQPQSNEQLPVKTVQWSVTAAQQGTINLDDVSGETVKLLNVSIPEGTIESINVKLTGEGTKYPDYNITADADGYVKVADLQKAVTEMYTVEAIERTFNALASSDVKLKAVETEAAVRMQETVSGIKVVPQKPKFNPFIYEIGNSQSWSVSAPLYCANGDGKYQGYYYLDGGYKFKPNADNWDGDWGQDPNGSEGTLVQDGEKDCQAEAGFYQIDVDLAAMTYKTTLVSTISIIGTVNGNWDTDTDLTYNTETGAWEVTAALKAGAMKFRMNHDWTISWGGANGDPKAYNNLTQNGGKDLDLPEDGNYFIQLFITFEGNNKVLVVKK